VFKRNKKALRFEQATMDWRLMESLGADKDLSVVDLWARKLSPARDGKLAAKAKGSWENLMVPHAIAAEMKKIRDARLPVVPPNKGIRHGYRCVDDHPLEQHLDTCNLPMLILGPTGAGKTTKAIDLFDQLVPQGKRLIIIDSRVDLRRIWNRYPNTLVLRPDQYFVNWLQHIGEARSHYLGIFQQICKFASTVSAQAASDMLDLMMRIRRGLASEDAHPSLKDLEKLLYLQGNRTGKSQWTTAAHGIRAFNEVLGKAAYVRTESPQLQAESQVLIFDLSGQDPRFYRPYCNLVLLRLRAQQVVVGHSSGLHTVFYVDEGKYLCSRAFSATIGSHYIEPTTIIMTGTRAFGIEPIISIQSVSDADDDLLSNAAAICSLGTNNPKEARLLQEVFQLDSPDHFMNLKKGQGWLQYPGLPNATKFYFDDLHLGNYLGDAELDDRQASRLDQIARHTVFSPTTVDDVAPLPYLEALGERVETTTPQPTSAVVSTAVLPNMLSDHFQFLCEVDRNRDCSISEHYILLGWRFAHGDRIKSELTDQNLIGVDRIEQTRGRPRQILALTEQGRILLQAYKSQKSI
jgi:hypothetical protein